MSPSVFMLKPHLIIEITNPLLVLLDGLNKQAFKTMEEGYIYFNKHLKALPSRRGGPAVRQKSKLVESADPHPNLTLAAPQE